MRYKQSQNLRKDYYDETVFKICPETGEKATISAHIRKQNECKTDIERTSRVIQKKCSLLQGNIEKFYTCSKCLSSDDLIL